MYVCMYVLYNMKQEKKQQKKNQIELFVSHFIYLEKENTQKKKNYERKVNVPSQVKSSQVESS